MSTNLSELSAGLAGLVSQAAPRIVGISGPGMGPASGIIWRSGLIVTAEEALDGGENLQVARADGSTTGATLIGRDPSTDVALLRADTGDWGDWAVAATPPVGSLTVVVGRGAESPLAALALVSETGGPWQSMNGGRIDARVRLGLVLSGRAEGGAALSPEGGLIGMAVTGPRRRTLVIPAATIARAVDALSSRGYVARGYLGIKLQPLDSHSGQRGALVIAVEPQSPAANAGLVVGDIITTWNDAAIAGPGDLAQRLGTESAGQSVKLGLIRGGASHEVDVVIGERRLGQ